MKTYNQLMNEAKNASFSKTDKGDWLVAPCSTKRDASVLVSANFSAMLKVLKSGEFEILRHSHWAVGWVEIVIVRPGTESERVCKEIEDGLNDYPVVDDGEFSIFENEEVRAIWKGKNLSDRIELINNHNENAIKHGNKTVSIFASRKDDCPAGVYDLIKERYVEY